MATIFCLLLDIILCTWLWQSAPNFKRI